MKIKHLAIFIAFISLSINANAQEFITRTGHIVFSSKTPLESIDGNNYSVSSILNTKTGEIIFSVVNKSFQFKQSLMEEHFNEKYMESDKYPKSTFKGKVKDLSKVNFTKDGTYKVEVEGELTMHGVTKTITVLGTIEVKGAEINAKATFTVVPEDYKIEIPGLVREKIAKIIPIVIEMNYKAKK